MSGNPWILIQMAHFILLDSKPFGQLMSFPQ